MAAKHEITVEAQIDPDGSLLGNMAHALSLAVLPEYFVWSVMEGSNEARIWMTVEITDVELQELLFRLRSIPGIRNVYPLGPGAAILRSLD